MRAVRAIVAIAIAIASALIAIGILLIFVLPSGGGVPLTVDLPNGETGHPLYVFVTTQRTVGFAFMWIATLFLAGVIGKRLTGTRLEY